MEPLIPTEYDNRHQINMNAVFLYMYMYVYTVIYMYIIVIGAPKHRLRLNTLVAKVFYRQMTHLHLKQDRLWPKTLVSHWHDLFMCTFWKHQTDTERKSILQNGQITSGTLVLTRLVTQTMFTLWFILGILSSTLGLCVVRFSWDFTQIVVTFV